MTNVWRAARRRSELGSFWWQVPRSGEYVFSGTWFLLFSGRGLPPPANTIAIWLFAGTRKGCPYMAKHVPWRSQAVIILREPPHGLACGQTMAPPSALGGLGGSKIWGFPLELRGATGYTSVLRLGVAYCFLRAAGACRASGYGRPLCHGRGVHPISLAQTNSTQHGLRRS